MKCEDKACIRSIWGGKSPGSVRTVMPLLLTACERDLPNTDVARILIEEMAFGADAKTKLLSRGGNDLVDDATALHALAGAAH